jgi:predicted RNase H-like HicB family nuclease
MQYTAFLTNEGKQTLAEFPGCPGCQTFAGPGENIVERAEEALAGWLEAHLVTGQAPPEPKRVRAKGTWANYRGVGARQAGPALGTEAGGLESGRIGPAGRTEPTGGCPARGPNHNPTLDTLERVAAALGTRLEVGLKAA